MQLHMEIVSCARRPEMPSLLPLGPAPLVHCLVWYICMCVALCDLANYVNILRLFS